MHGGRGELTWKHLNRRGRATGNNDQQGSWRNAAQNGESQGLCTMQRYIWNLNKGTGFKTAANCQLPTFSCLRTKGGSSSSRAPLTSSLWGQCAKADGETATLELWHVLPMHAHRDTIVNVCGRINFSVRVSPHKLDSKKQITVHTWQKQMQILENPSQV